MSNVVEWTVLSVYQEVSDAIGMSLRVSRAASEPATGTLMPKPRSGRPRAIARQHVPALVAALQAQPDATLAEHRTTWAATQGIVVSVATMHRALGRVGWTRQKRP